MHFNTQIEKIVSKFAAVKHAYIILVLLLNAACIFSKTNPNEILNTIMVKSIGPSINNEPNTLIHHKMNLFMGRILAEEASQGRIANTTCNSKVVQSNVQAKMRTLKSVLSMCGGYCRIAMSEQGLIYGDKQFSLESTNLRILN